MTEEVPLEEEGTVEQVSPWEQLRRDVATKQQRATDFANTVRTTREVLAAEEVARVRPSAWKEAGKAVWGAGVDLTTELTILAKELQTVVAPFEAAIAGTAYAAQAEWGDKYEAFGRGIAESRAENELGKQWLRAKAEQIAPDNETFLGGASRGILQFAVPYIGWAKAAGAASTFRAATARGFFIDMGLFDPNEGNLSNLIKELTPDQQSLVTEFLATDPNDNESLNRLRNGLEGAALGTVLEGIFRMARSAIHANKVRAARQRADADPDQMLTAEKISKLTSEGKIKPKQEPVKTDKAPDAPDADAPVKNTREVFSEEHLRETLKMSSAQRQAFNDALLVGNDKAASEILELADFNIETIDWENVSDPGAIKTLINTVSEIMADHIDDVKGGVQTHEQTKRLANLVGFSGDQVHHLFKDIRGDKGIAARFYAAKRTMMLAAREAQRLIQESKAAPSDLAKKSAVMKHLQLYSALQAEVKGAQTEVARALNAMKILQDDAGTGFREFDEIMKSFGSKHSSGAKAYEKYMDSLLDALDRGDLDAFNQGVRRTTGERVKNIVVEYVINAMLSSPKTHLINLSSNFLNTGLYSIDRVLGGAYRRLRHGDHAAWQEARIDVHTKFASMGEAWKLARMAWKEGAPISDKRQRLEFQTRKAISAEGTVRDATAADAKFGNFGERFNVQRTELVRDSDGNIIKAVDYTWMQRAINTMGRYVRVPGRALIAGDEFFKTINRNAEMQVLAFRQADDEAVEQGLKWGTKEYEKAVNKRLRTLLDPDSADEQAKRIRVEAVQKSRRVTFQEAPTTDTGGKMEKAVNANAFVKLLLAPFFRTPMNILRQATVDRMPWGRFIGDTRTAIMEGHPRARAEAEARMLTGMSAMTVAFSTMWNLDEDSPVEFVGKMPYDSVRRATGVKDYSIRIGEEWFQFNRLDPLGMWVGMMADVVQTVKKAEEEDEAVAFAMMQGALGTTLSNVLNKTWFKSMADLIEFAERASAEGTTSESATRAWAQFAGGQLGKFIPQVVKSVGKETEELLTDADGLYAKEAWTAWENLLSQIPWANDELPLRYDIIGRPRKLNIEAVNPFAHSDAAESPIEKELWRLNFRMQPMKRSYGEVGMAMTAEEYSKMNRYVGEGVFGEQSLEDRLNEVVSDPDWETKTDERKIYELKLYISAARSAATAKMLLDKDFMRRFKTATRDEARKLVE